MVKLDGAGSGPGRQGKPGAFPALSAWLDYRATRASAGSSIVGDLRLLPELWSPQLEVSRDVMVLLPQCALDSGRRYPVLYMHDGQNLFDAATSFVGEWQVDETLAALAGEGIEPIVVGIPNGGDRRFAEYTPYRGTVPGAVGGLGRAYLRFLVETVKPLVDATFPTRTDRAATGIMGSSLGGLISLWGAVEHGSTFGLVGALSPAMAGGQGRILGHLRHLDVRPDRVYLDVGGAEGSHLAADPASRRWAVAFPRDAYRLRAALVSAGFTEPLDLRFVFDPDGVHNESAWSRRLPDALRFLYGRSLG
jgi:predicted alpha/beta superfamily hydrolase